MNIEQLQYIIKVAETRSISSSSEILHISQTGISMAGYYKPGERTRYKNIQAIANRYNTDKRGEGNHPKSL
ncbi:LysR family transcriptional regulator [Bacillus sp. XF8]|uniref:LysR family transcriptional regulator n=1 Tax=Bacillus sp. XF8 TaxID=2819289 RepID=UPI001AA08E6E|nr:LysR family transcriptional regulator [Bacillus sp. XF8]MBO1580407.1 LysR family transcriptional regulator [Bacillus sp. XF8]